MNKRRRFKASRRRRIKSLERRIKARIAYLERQGFQLIRVQRI